MFHVYGDYAIQQARHVRSCMRVAEQQPLGTSPKRLSWCFSNFPYTNRREVTKFENIGQPRVRRIISLDF